MIMRKVAGFLALGLLGGLIGTQLPGATDSYQLKVIGLPAVAQQALVSSGAHITQQGSVAVVEGRSKKAAFQALSQAHLLVQGYYDKCWEELEACEDGGVEVNAVRVEQELDNAELGLSVIEQAMQQLDPSLITP
jgi:hypothetical protein